MLCLSWGVIPKIVDFMDSTDKMTQQIDYELVKHGVAEIDDLVVMVAGSPPGVPGTTNMLKVHRIGMRKTEVAPA